MKLTPPTFTFHGKKYTKSNKAHFEWYKIALKEQKFPFLPPKIQEYLILAAVFVHKGP